MPCAARKQLAAECGDRHLGPPRFQPARRAGQRMHPHRPHSEATGLMQPRSWLFVPADSERKITKALDSDADAIIFDLEDSVAPAIKSVARDLLKSLLKRSGGPEWWVRVNPLGAEFIRDDLDLLGIADIRGVV